MKYQFIGKLGQRNIVLNHQTFNNIYLVQLWNYNFMLKKSQDQKNGDKSRGTNGLELE